jgi:hypothetical protein
MPDGAFISYCSEDKKVASRGKWALRFERATVRFCKKSTRS